MVSVPEINATKVGDIKKIPIVSAADISESKRLCEAYQFADKDFEQAEINFNNADSEYIDIAILELQAKRLKRDLLYRQYLECERKIKN